MFMSYIANLVASHDSQDLRAPTNWRTLRLAPRFRVACQLPARCTSPASHAGGVVPRQTVSAARPVARRRRDLPGGDTSPRLARPAAACPTAVLSIAEGTAESWCSHGSGAS